MMGKDRPILYLAVGETLVWAALLYVFPAMIVRWEEAFGWSKTELTGAITLAIFMSALASPIAGRLIDHGLGAAMMAGSALAGGVCLVALSMVTTLVQFYVVWAIIGILLAGCLYDPCFALITRARGAEAKRGIILITLVAGFASTISFPAIHVLADDYGWRTAVQVFAGVVVFVAVPLMWLGASGVEKTGTHPDRAASLSLAGRNAFLGRAVFWFLAVGFGFAAILHGVTLQHLLPILDDREISTDVAVMAASFIGPMQVAGRLAMIAAEKHVSIHGVTIACYGLMCGSVVLLLAAGSVPELLVAFVIFYGGAYGTLSIIRPLVARELLGGGNFGAKSGALSLIYLCGSASAAYLGSLIWGLGGYDLVLQTLLVLGVAGLILYLLARRRSSAVTDHG
jgi:ethanolamine utilization microcompartment shell protein EutS